jgi:hypothetical protein
VKYPGPIPAGAASPNPAGTNGVACCLHCGKRLSFFARLSGKRRFCSAKHERHYKKETERLAMEALNWQPVAKAQRTAQEKRAALKPAQKQDKKIRQAPQFVEPARAGIIALEPRVTAQPSEPGLRQSSSQVFRPRRIVVPEMRLRNAPAIFKAPPMPEPPTAGPVRIEASGWACPLSFPLRPGSSQLFRPKRVIIPELCIEKRVQEFIPESMPSISSTPEVMKSAGAWTPSLRRLQVAVETRIDWIQVVGVIDADENQTPRSTKPSVIGDPVNYQRAPVVGASARCSLRLKRTTAREQGIFVPRFGMGTLRPRVAFGPAPENLPPELRRRTVTEMRPPRRKTSTEPDARQSAARARGATR